MFFKLFVSFWLTMIVGGAVSVAVVSTYQHFAFERIRENMDKRNDRNLADLIVLSGQAAWEMYRCGGIAEYRNYVDGLAARARTRIHLIGDDGRSLTGETLPEELANLAETARKKDTVLIRRSGENLIVAKHLKTENGGSGVVIGVHAFGHPPGMRPPPPEGKLWPFLMNGPPDGPPPPPDGKVWSGEAGKSPMPPPENLGHHPWIRFLPPFFSTGEIIRTVIMLLAVTGVCYFLARSLVRPIRKLQHMAQRIADGDYSARVGKSLGRAGNELAALGRDFDIMADRTDTLISAQKRLLRDISHELRSPLSRLNVALELAKNRFGAADDDSLAKIGKEADRLNELIGHLLTLAWLESGAGMGATEKVNLAELLREVTQDVDFEVSGNGRGVKLDSPDDVSVEGSRELLRSAIENIVRNAANYTAPDTWVDIKLTVSEKEAIIQVADHGPGVPEQDLPHLFKPFYRVAEARERRSGGVGIGLAIAEQAVKAHHGRVMAENGNKGLIVTVALPINP